MRLLGVWCSAAQLNRSVAQQPVHRPAHKHTSVPITTPFLGAVHSSTLLTPTEATLQYRSPPTLNPQEATTCRKHRRPAQTQLPTTRTHACSCAPTHPHPRTPQASRHKLHATSFTPHASTPHASCHSFTPQLPHHRCPASHAGQPAAPAHAALTRSGPRRRS